MTALACDFGGRRIKLGVVRSGVLLSGSVLSARADRPLAERLPEVTRALRELCAACGLEARQCCGIGVSYPSIIHPTDGRVLDEFGKYGAVTSESLRAWADDEFGLPLAIENDARMALIGEWRHGAGRRSSNVAILMLGTGLGTAAVIGGQPLRGPHGQAGILGGHLTVQQAGRPCVCGNVGCAEAEASTSVLAELARQTPGFAESPLAAEADLSYRAVFQWADRGDGCAARLKEHSLRVWGATAVNLIHAYDPEVLILGGGIMGSGDVVLPAITAWVRNYAHTPGGQVRIVASDLGDHAALLAAEWLLEEYLAKTT